MPSNAELFRPLSDDEIQAQIDEMAGKAGIPDVRPQWTEMLFSQAFSALRFILNDRRVSSEQKSSLKESLSNAVAMINPNLTDRAEISDARENVKGLILSHIAKYREITTQRKLTEGDFEQLKEHLNTIVKEGGLIVVSGAQREALSLFSEIDRVDSVDDFVKVSEKIDVLQEKIFSQLKTELLALCDDNKVTGMLSQVTSLFAGGTNVGKEIDKIRAVVDEKETLTELIDAMNFMKLDVPPNKGSFHDRLQKIVTRFMPHQPTQSAFTSTDDATESLKPLDLSASSSADDATVSSQAPVLSGEDASLMSEIQLATSPGYCMHPDDFPVQRAQFELIKSIQANENLTSKDKDSLKAGVLEVGDVRAKRGGSNRAAAHAALKSIAELNSKASDMPRNEGSIGERLEKILKDFVSERDSPLVRTTITDNKGVSPKSPRLSWIASIERPRQSDTASAGNPDANRRSDLTCSG